MTPVVGMLTAGANIKWQVHLKLSNIPENDNGNTHCLKNFKSQPSSDLLNLNP
jgi:hypothetical protein